MLKDGEREGDYVFEDLPVDERQPIGPHDTKDILGRGVWRFMPIVEEAGESVDRKEMFYWGGYDEPVQPLCIRHPQMGVIEGVERMKMTHGWTKDRACRFAADGWRECRLISEPEKDEEALNGLGMPQVEPATYRAIRVLVIEGTKAFVRETIKRSVIDEKASTAFLEQGGTISYRCTKLEKVLDVDEAELWRE